MLIVSFFIFVSGILSQLIEDWHWAGATALGQVGCYMLHLQGGYGLMGPMAHFHSVCTLQYLP